MPSCSLDCCGNKLHLRLEPGPHAKRSAHRHAQRQLRSRSRLCSGTSSLRSLSLRRALHSLQVVLICQLASSIGALQ